MSNTDGQMYGNWLDSTLDTNSTNEAISHNGCTITSTKSKVNIFINHYTRVSNLHTTKEVSNINCLLKQRLNTPSVDNKSCTPINILELLLELFLGTALYI